MTKIAIEHHHVSWVNQLLLWQFSIVMLVYQRVCIYIYCLVARYNHILVGKGHGGASQLLGVLRMTRYAMPNDPMTRTVARGYLGHEYTGGTLCDDWGSGAEMDGMPDGE